MSLSGSYDYTFTGAQIIQEAMELIGKAGVGFSISAEDQQTCLRTLNLMIKALPVDTAMIWAITEGFLFPSYGGYSFSIGPSGDHAAVTAYKTEISVASDSGDATITVDSDDDITDGDYIGIELDDKTLQWTTVNGTPAANVVTLDDVLTDDVTVDNHVYNYTTKIQRPMEIIEARLHYSDDTETPMFPLSRQEYMALSNKDSSGPPTNFYYQPTLTNGVFRTWPATNNVKEYIKFSAKIQLQDVDLATQNVDFPPEWLLALSWNLAVLIAPKFGKMLPDKFDLRAIAMMQDVIDYATEEEPIVFTMRSR